MSAGGEQRKRSANIARNSKSQGLNEEACHVVAPPAKRLKPLSPIKNITSEPPSQPCNSKRETDLCQESIVSPPMTTALHTSASPSSLESPLLEPPSSQHMMIRWGPMSPAFLIKDSHASPSPPLRRHHRAPPPRGPAQQGRRKRIRPEKTAQLLEALSALIRAGSANESSSSKGGEGSGLEGTEEGGPPSSVTGGDNDDVQDEEFHLGGFEDDSELLADLLNVSSTSWDDLHPPRLKGESDGNSTEGAATARDASQRETSGEHKEPDLSCQEHTVAEDSLETTAEDEFWAAAEDYLATQEERGLCNGPPRAHLSSAEYEQESPLEVSQDEFDLLLSQADEGHLQVCEKETPRRPTQPARFVRL